MISKHHPTKPYKQKCKSKLLLLDRFTLRANLCLYNAYEIGEDQSMILCDVCLSQCADFAQQIHNL
jgi:hypothetical protein